MAQMKSFDVVDFVKRFLTFSLKDGSKKDALGYKAILNTGFDLRAPVEVSLLLMFKNERDALAAKLEVEIDFDVKIITNDDETILLGTTAVHVFAVPGHTQGSAAYLVDGVLFLGDAADFGRDHALIGSPWIFSDSQQQDRESLMNLERRLQPMADQVKAIDCAHSGLLSNGIAPLTQFSRG